VQLKEHVLRKHPLGEWRSGERVPSEHSSCAVQGVAHDGESGRLAELMRSGVLARLQASGTFRRRPQGGNPSAAKFVTLPRKFAIRVTVIGALPVTLERALADETVRARLGSATARLRFFTHSSCISKTTSRCRSRIVCQSSHRTRLSSADFTALTPYEY